MFISSAVGRGFDSRSKHTSDDYVLRAKFDEYPIKLTNFPRNSLKETKGISEKCTNVYKMDQKWMNFKIFLPKIKFLLLFFWPNVHLHWVWVCHYIIYISYFEKETKGPTFHIYMFIISRI